MTQKLTISRTKLGQRGMASFIVVIVLMLIISLVTLGFAKVIRRQQRQVLDRNLNTQAFYAAESGINLAQKVLTQNPTLPAKTQCGADANFTFTTGTPSLIVDGNTNVSVNCLTTNTSLTSLDYQTVSKYRSLVVPVNGVNAAGVPTAVNSLTLSWDNTVPTSGYCGARVGFPAAASWSCKAPLLRIDLVDVSGTFDRSALPGRTYTFFAYPLTSGGTTTFTGGTQGAIVNGQCNTANTPYHCNLTINGLASTNYAMRVLSMYSNASLNVRAGGAVLLSGAQALIDATGKAQDVVRRVQVHIPLAGNQYVPDFGVQSASGICKRYLVDSGTVTLDPADGNITDAANICAIP